MVSKPDRSLVGISLSGLFAIWASTKTGMFKCIASISGSLWYDNLLSYFNETEINPSVEKFVLILGDKGLEKVMGSLYEEKEDE